MIVLTYTLVACQRDRVNDVEDRNGYTWRCVRGTNQCVRIAAHASFRTSTNVSTIRYVRTRVAEQLFTEHVRPHTPELSLPTLYDIVDSRHRHNTTTTDPTMNTDNTHDVLPVVIRQMFADELRACQ